MSIYDFTVKTSDDTDVLMSDYKGKVILIVNTATRCGFTPQYGDLQKLYETFHKDGFEILDFPCNQFGNQAPESNEGIHEFCTVNFGITFKQLAKVEVNGKNEEPLYTFLKKEKHGFLSNKIKWNFTKFLVNREGKVVGRFPATYNLKKLTEVIRNYCS